METNSDEFEEFQKSSNTVWKHFLRSADRETGKCKLCNAFIKTSGRSTTGLHTHLRTKHGIDTKSLKPSKIPNPHNESTSNEESFDAAIATPSQSKIITFVHDKDDVKDRPAKRSKITDYFEVIDPVPRMVSRMLAHDGLLFKIFTTSEDMKDLCVNAGYTLPDSLISTKEMVMKYGSDVKKRFVQKFLRLKNNNGQKFNLTVDEWTTMDNRRYLNLNIHTKSDAKVLLWNIGLIRVTGCLPVELCVKIIKSKLQEFGLDLEKDIVAIITDGASIMEKVGKLIGPTQQLCSARILQETILDVFYSSKKEDPRNKMIHKYDSDDSEDEMMEFCNDSFRVTSAKAEGIEISLPEYAIVINKMRKIIIMFKKSRSNFMLLQNYMTQEFGKEIKLKLDSKNNWSTLISFTEMFIQLKSCIRRVQVDLKLGSEYCLSENEFNLINDLNRVLLIFKLGVEVLCSKNANLMTAERILGKTVEKLEQRTTLSQKLASALSIKIKQRETNLTYVLKYLHDSRKYRHENFNNKPSKLTIIKEIVSLLQRLPLVYSSAESQEVIEDGQKEIKMNIQDQDPLECTSSLSKEEPEDDVYDTHIKIERADVPLSQLAEDLETDTTLHEKTDHKKRLDETIMKEMAVYETEGTKGEHLKTAYEYLLNIPPASIDMDTAFSVSLTGKKIECHQNDDTIDVLFFLRKYFLLNKTHL